MENGGKDNFGVNKQLAEIIGKRLTELEKNFETYGYEIELYIELVKPLHEALLNLTIRE
jgi:hypothetical protein